MLMEVMFGGNLSRPGLVQALVRSGGTWEAVTSFCEAVMRVKEEAERVRETQASSSRHICRETHNPREIRQVASNKRKRSIVFNTFST